MKAKRKSISLLLALIIVLQSFVYSDIKANHIEDRVVIDNSSNFEEENREIEKVTPITKEKTRVMVELQSPSVLEVANKEGISIKDSSSETLQVQMDRLGKEQKTALQNLEEEKLIDNSVEADIIHYTHGFNGLAMTIDTEDIETIKNQDFVKNVYVVEEFERPLMNESNTLIGADYAWNNGQYLGDGSVVAIIDTGIDHRHIAMYMPDDVVMKHTETDMEELIEKHNLKGSYFTDKVPYGYNYYDHNQNTLDSYGSMHGMHVAGIVGANATLGNISGVAPNAQLLAMKVFSDDLQYPTTFTDVWLKAVDDAILLGADVINMSLGAPAGFRFNDPTRPEIETLRRAREAGVVVVVAAGNEANLLHGNFYNEKAKKDTVDIGLVASPSLHQDTISVASVDNKVEYVTYLSYRNAGSEKKARINIKMPNDEEKAVTAEAVYVGEGFAEDYNNKDVAGKIIIFTLGEEKEHQDEHDGTDAAEIVSEEEQAETVVKEETKEAAEEAEETAIETEEKTAVEIEVKTEISTEPEVEKTVNPETVSDEIMHTPKESKLTVAERVQLAYLKNPAGIILWNDEKRGNSIGRRLPPFPGVEVPVAWIGHDDGKALVDLTVTSPVEVTVSSILQSEPSKTEGKISYFSSWGPAPDLAIKPEIAAPGGNIYSTAEDDKYQKMSGTSMASPHIAGVSAILKQFLKAEGRPHQLDDIKLLMMNTATPVKYNDRNIDFVRKQGAGLVNLEKALKTKVLVRAKGGNDTVYDGKLELGAVSTGLHNVQLQLENLSDTEKRFSLGAITIADRLTDDRWQNSPRNIPGILMNQVIVLEPNQTKEVEVQLNWSFLRGIVRDGFVEGYLQFTDMDSANGVDLSIPFLAFYGDFTKPRAIDAFEIKEYGKGKVEPQLLVNREKNAHASLFLTPQGLPIPIISDTLYFTPENTTTGDYNYFPKVGVRLAPLRNMEKVEYSIVDAETKEVLHKIGESVQVRKLSRLAGRYAYRNMPDSIWDGKIAGKWIKDGQKVLYQIKATLNDNLENPTVQIYEYPISVDKTAPKFVVSETEKILVSDDLDKKNIEFSVEDTGSGVKSVYLQSVYFRRRFPSTKPGEAPNPRDNDPVDPEVVGETPDLRTYKPQYGRSLQLEFVSPNAADIQLASYQSEIIRVENGVLTVPTEYVRDGIENIKLYCDINGHEGRKIRVKTPFYPTQGHTELLVTDALSNKTRTYVRTKVLPKFEINFTNAYNSLIINKGEIRLNDEVFKGAQKYVNGRVKVSISFPAGTTDVKTLAVRRGRVTHTLVENNALKEEWKSTYQVSKDGDSYHFYIEETGGKVDIVLNASKKVVVTEKAALSFEEGVFEKLNFGEFTIMTKNIRGVVYADKNNPTVQAHKGVISIESRLKTGVEVESVQVETGGVVRTIPKGTVDNFTVLDEAFMIGYQGDLKIKLNFQAASKVMVRFKSERTNQGDTTLAFGEENTGQKKYPVIFLKTPDLLSIRNAASLRDDIHVVGFVGYLGEEKLKQVEISLIDAKGNVLGEKKVIGKESLIEQAVEHVNGGRPLYRGNATHFATKIRSSYFHTNIRVEGITESGKRISIVRRLFVDDAFPTLTYHVKTRNLSDDKAVIDVTAMDNSFQLKLYQNGSLVESKDLLNRSFEEKDAKISKTIELPLAVGQNRIELSAKDTAKQEVKKVIYIYRTLR